VPELPNEAKSTPKKLNAPARLFRWLDQRTGVHDLLEESLDEPIPGGARLAYVFGSGLLYIFISQIITGICLALYYVPSAETAHTSVAYITKQVAAGSFLRSLHYYGSSAMIIVLALHFLQTFLYGSFKGRRELLWMSGAVLSLLVLGMGFSGYLLPWDQKAYFATAVGTNIVGEIPIIGQWLTQLLRGGDTLGTLTLSRFYVAHVFLIPACIFGFIAAHILLFRKAGPAGPIAEDPINPKMAPEGFYPKQVLMDMTFALLIMVFLAWIAYFHPVGLGPIADPASAQFIARPEWYYLSFFEWLKFWEGPKVVFAVVVFPGILALAFFLIPFLDRKLERRPWRRPIPVLAVAIVMVGAIYLGIRSHQDDMRDPSTAAQLALQEKQETAYTAAPFEPYIEAPGGTAPAAYSGPANPLIAHGRGIFEAHGCNSCHGAGGTGGPIAPKLIGINAKLPGDQLSFILTHPTLAMKTGKMPAIDISTADMSALVAYLDALGTPAANAPAASSGPSEAALAASGQFAPGPNGTLLKTTTAGVAFSPAIAGKQMFESRGCSACHGQNASGGRAPAIPPVIAPQSDAEVLALIQAPNAKMKAGGMAPVTGDPADLHAIVAYLRTLGHAPATPAEIAVAAAPLPPPVYKYPDPEPDTPVPSPPTTAATAAPVATAGPAGASAAEPVSASINPAIEAGHTVFVNEGCAACHGPTARGTHFAPTLHGVATKYPGDALPNLLHHPDAKMRAGGMPPVRADAAELKQLVAFLDNLDIVPSATAATSTHVAANLEKSGSPPLSASAGAANTVASAPPPPSPLSIAGQRVFEHYSCESCHGAAGLRGTVAAPGLAGTASILPAATIEHLLRHHSTQMVSGNMPPTTMNPNDLKAVIAYIRSMPTAP
jgi:ubiquinol-cytochrome c reductase cytochrome b subunit